MTEEATARTAAIGSKDSSAAVERAATFEARPATDWATLADRWDPPVDCPFQHRIWIESWYDTLGREPGVRPLPVEVSDGGGRLAALLPLVAIVRNGRTVITFADEELTDYNAPLLGPAVPSDSAGARRFWQAVRRVLPPADLFVLRKSPYRLGERVNPLSLLAGAGLCAANGNLITIGESFAAYHRSLGKPVRSELDRSWRVFQRAAGARFSRVTDPAAAGRILAATDAQQRVRFDETGVPFALDGAGPAAFYRLLAARGVAGGYTYISALECDAEIVATLVAFVTGKRVVVTRISNAGRAWSNCSPGRLVLHRAMMDLHEKGIREFDFSIGNFDYKRRFGVTPFPLFDLFVPLSWKGAIPTARARAASGLRKYPALDARLRKLVGA